MHTQTAYSHKVMQPTCNGPAAMQGNSAHRLPYRVIDSAEDKIRRQRLALLRDDEAIIEAFLNQTDCARSEQRSRVLASALSCLAQWQRRQLEPNGTPCYPDGLRIVVEGNTEAIRQIITDYESILRSKAERVREAVSALRQTFPVGAKAIQRWRDETLIASYRQLESDTDGLDLSTTQLRHLAEEVPQGLVGLLRQSPDARERALDDFIASIPATVRRCQAASQLRQAVASLLRSLDQGRLCLPKQPPPLPPRRHMV